MSNKNYNFSTLNNCLVVKQTPQERARVVQARARDRAQVNAFIKYPDCPKRGRGARSV